LRPNSTLAKPKRKAKQIKAKMPGEIIDRPNPQPLASQIPDAVLGLSVKLEKTTLSDADLKGLEDFRRASNYIAAGKFAEQPLFQFLESRG
jgi:hypothetical protein